MPDKGFVHFLSCNRFWNTRLRISPIRSWRQPAPVDRQTAGFDFATRSPWASTSAVQASASTRCRSAVFVHARDRVFAVGLELFPAVRAPDFGKALEAEQGLQVAGPAAADDDKPGVTAFHDGVENVAHAGIRQRFVRAYPERRERAVVIEQQRAFPARFAGAGRNPRDSGCWCRARITVILSLLPSLSPWPDEPQPVIRDSMPDIRCLATRNLSQVFWHDAALPGTSSYIIRPCRLEPWGSAVRTDGGNCYASILPCIGPDSSVDAVFSRDPVRCSDA